MTPKINKSLKGVQTQIQLQLILKWAARGLAIGALIAVVMMIVSKFVPMGFDLIRTSVSMVVAGLFLGITAALFKPITLFDAAFSADVKLGIKERLTSAIEFAKDKDSNPLIPALIKDAERHAVKIKPSRDFPIRIPREIVYALALILITAGLYFVPPWQYVFASDETRDEYTNVAAEAERVRQIAQEIRIDPPPERTDFAEQIARELEQLAEDMEFGTLTRREALERLSAIENAIDQVASEEGFDDLQEQFERLAEELARNEDLSDVSDALQDGNAQAAEEAINRLAADLEAGRVPAENLKDMANALNEAINPMGDDPETQELRDALAQARDEMMAAAEQGEGMSGQVDPAEMAEMLIESIDNAIPEIQDLDIAQDVIDRAIEMLEEVRDDLQAALDSGEVTQEDITDAQQRIQEVRQMLEEAGADFGDEDTRTDEEIADALIEEAERLEQACQNSNQLSSEQSGELQSTCQNVAQGLQEQISEGSCSSGSNQEARQRLDEVRRQLEESGTSQEEMGEKTDCSGGQCNNPGSGDSQSGQNSRAGSSMSSLFGMPSSMGMPSRMGQSMGEAASACRSAGQSMGRFGQSLGSCSSFSKMKQGICRSRSSISGNCSRPGGQGSCNTGGQNWGTGSSPYQAGTYGVEPGAMNDPSEDPNANPDEYRDYEEIYASRFKPGQFYDVQLEGKLTDVGGSYIFTEVVDPQTGETSYIPYFELETSDVATLMDAMEDQDIPRSYADFVRFYFEQLAAGSE